MVNLLNFIGYALICVIVYVFIGYPIILFILDFILPKSIRKKDPITPSVSFLISCYNEEEIIQDKLLNAVAMDYPIDKIEIIVISDCSSDKTDDIVKGFDATNVRLIRMEERLGKTMGINYAVSQAKGEVIVFSDANAMYEKNAIRQLVRNFSDNRIGYVVGEARYIKRGDGASISEQTYWNYECRIKKIESRLHSVVGGDGAIYAIRRELYEPLLESDINDFVNPLQIISKGYRGVYEDEAVCWEEAAGSFNKEFNRKSRIVNRSFSGLLRVPSVLNPFHTGFFSFEVISHKLLRWLTPFFFLILMGVSIGLAAYGSITFKIVLSLEIVIIILAYLGYVKHVLLNFFIFYFPYYFISVNVASIIGISKRFSGKIDVTWNTVRATAENSENRQLIKPVYIHLGMLMIVIISYFIFLSEGLYTTPYWIVKIIFNFSFWIILYIYLLYPMILLIWSKLRPKIIIKGDVWPQVALLICAYNEEEVITEKIENCLDIDYPFDKIKVYIASDGSSDRTNEIVQAYSDSRVHFINYTERSGKIGAIIKTMGVIESDIVVFSDANTMIKSDAIRHLISNFNDQSVGCVSADVIVLNDKTTYGRSESLYYKYERWIQKKESSINSVIGVDGGLYAIRRNLYVHPSPDIILDDFVISINTTRNGHRLIYDENAIGYEGSENSYSTEFLKKSRVVAGAFQALLKREGLPPREKHQMVFSYISHKFLRWLTPVFLISLYMSTVYLMFVTGNKYLLAFMTCQSVFYVLASFGLLYKGPIRSPIIYIPFYFCLVNGSALYGMYKGLMNKQSVKWKVFKRKQGSC